MAETKAKSHKNEKGHGNLFYIVIAVMVAAVLLFSIGYVVYNALRTSVNWNAATIGGEKVSPQEVSFHYYLEYNRLYETYGEYIGYILDSSLPLSGQQYSEGKTWHDHLVESALESLQDTIMLEREAKAAGMTLTEENLQSMSDILGQTETAAASTGMTADQYLANVFADTRMTMEKYKTYLERSMLADNYMVKIREEYRNGYTEGDISAYFEEHRQDYELVTYRRVYFSGVAVAAEGEEEPTEEATAAAMKAAEEKATAMVSRVTDEDSFIALAEEYADEDTKEYYEDPDYTLYKDSSSSAISAELRDWAYDKGRKAGDVTFAESSAGYFVAFFLDRYLDDYSEVSVRHLLVNPEVDEGAEEATDEQWAAAKAEAERLYEEWKTGAATEETFAEFANEHSDDTGSNTTGGLYENIIKGMMVEPFADWCFDKSRKPGDTGIVETEFGFHIMYFSERGEVHWRKLVLDALTSADYSAWRTEKNEGFPIKEHGMGLSKVGMNFS